jgi:hypothetical protein
MAISTIFYGVNQLANFSDSEIDAVDENYKNAF